VWGVRHLIVLLLFVFLFVYLFSIGAFLVGFRGDSAKSTMPSLDFATTIDGARGFIYALLAVTVVAIIVVVIYRRTKVFGIKPDELTKHVVIAGPTGSEKTITAKSIIKQVKEKKSTAVVVIDWSGEYVDALPNATVVHALNPFGRSYTKEYAAVLSSMFHGILSLSEPQTHLFYSAVVAEFEERAKGDSRKPPTINDIMVRLDRMAPQSRFDYEIRLGLQRRLLPLIFSEEEGVVIGDGGDVRVDVSKLKTREEKTLMSLLALYHYYNEALTQPEDTRRANPVFTIERLGGVSLLTERYGIRHGYTDRYSARHVTTSQHFTHADRRASALADKPAQSFCSSWYPTIGV